MRNVRVGDMDAAARIFREMPDRDSVSWSSLIGGYVKLRRYTQALEIFREMQGNGIEPTELTLVSILGACAEVGDMELGKGIHIYLESKGIAADGYVGNALVDMYAKYGRLEVAKQVFCSMSIRDITCWNTMIVGLSVHGHSREALDLFDSMKVDPDHVTFVGVLTACSHSGLVNEGRAYFKSMVEDYRIVPNVKHYGCMTFHELHQLMPVDDGDVIAMSNVYAEANRWDDVKHLRTKVIRCSVSKHAAHSQVDVR